MTDKEIILQTLNQMKQFDGFTSIDQIFIALGIKDDIAQRHLLDILTEHNLVIKSNYSNWVVQITILGRRLDSRSYDRLSFNNQNQINIIHNETILGDKIEGSSLRDFKPKTINHKEEPLNKSKIKAFFYNPYSVTIIGGLILSFLIWLFSNTNSVNGIYFQNFKKPLCELQNYKIIAANNRSVDTLLLKLHFQGSKVVLNQKIKLVRYKFTDQQYFYKETYMTFVPEIEILESFFKNPFLDSTNTIEKVIIQIKRKMIFDGYSMAYFKVEDKKIIGNLTLALSYSYQDKMFYDTLDTDIYIVKELEVEKTSNLTN